MAIKKKLLKDANWADITPSIPVATTSSNGLMSNADKSYMLDYKGFTSTSLNMITRQGLYRIAETSPDKPAGVNYGVMMVLHIPEIMDVQIVFAPHAKNKLILRMNWYEQGWSAWQVYQNDF